MTTFPSEVTVSDRRLPDDAALDRIARAFREALCDVGPSASLDLLEEVARFIRLTGRDFDHQETRQW